MPKEKHEKWGRSEMGNGLKESPKIFTDVNADDTGVEHAVVDGNAEQGIPVRDTVALESGTNFIETCRKYDGYR